MCYAIIPACGNAQEFPPAYASPTPQEGEKPDISHMPRELQLEVFVNGRSTGWVAAFSSDPERGLLIDAGQLRNVGIIPDPLATDDDGLVELLKMQSVFYRISEPEQAIYFNVFDASRVPRRVNMLNPVTDRGADHHDGGVLYGGLVNYLVRAETESIDGAGLGRGNDVGISGAFDMQLYSPVGRFSNNVVIDTLDENGWSDMRRLNSYWVRSDPEDMQEYRAGDLVSGGLIWTRPVRLGGGQISRNFGLRPDIVTNPLPAVNGSAAVPSTVDIYVNNARQYSTSVPDGPFEITNIPVVSGYGVTTVVVRDVMGQQQVMELPFFTSPRLLRKDLLDFTLSAGVARRNYGIKSNDYHGGPASIGTLRYGFSDDVTLTSHAEVSPDVALAGGGVVFNAFDRGILSFAAAGSSGKLGSGMQLSASSEFTFDGFYLYLRSQRSFAEYSDVAALASEMVDSSDSGTDGQNAYMLPPRALDQVALSLPLSFDPSVINLGFTNLENNGETPARIVSAAFNRRMEGNWTLFGNVYKNLGEDGETGIYLGLSVPLGRQHLTSSVSHRKSGYSTSVDIARPASRSVGDYGWRASASHGALERKRVAATYRAQAMQLSGDLEKTEDDYRMSLDMEGSAVMVGGDTFLGNRINGAFAVVDAGAPDMEIRSENRAVGRTAGNGKMLVPNLRPWEPNRISIDPVSLPLTADIGSVRRVVVPTDNGASSVDFNVRQQISAALVTLRDAQGNFIPPGSRGRLVGTDQTFGVGYDGQAYIKGLADKNHVIISPVGARRCEAYFDFEFVYDSQVQIDNVVCQPVSPTVPSP
ncbi:fimbrial assembly protein [Thalassospira marina]|uniref:Fimbrial assembly protein n=2 Tax=Thalassospira marina TaxID=2048283 RepID=A0ABM6QBB9_9PROT|nr:fimbrial assembly protein [Thalassospira marina]